MADAISLSLGIIQIIIQLIALILAYRLTRITGGFLAWWLIIAALVLMTVRRITAFIIEIGATSGLVGSVAFVDRIGLPLLISILLALAMFDLVKKFRHQLVKK